MQIRVNRRSIVHLLAVALAAVIALGAQPAFAQSTTVTPAGQSFTATANGTAPSTKVSLVLGTVTVTCNSTASGTVPAAPANQNPAGAVCGPIGTPTFTSCTSTLGTPTVTASGAWQFCAANNGGSPTGQLIIPQNGVTATVRVFGGLITCRAVAAPAGPASITGPFTNGVTPTLAFSGASVPVASSGGFGCPTGTTSTLTGTFAVSPTITVGP
jgi:hypothetical protein